MRIIAVLVISTLGCTNAAAPPESTPDASGGGPATAEGGSTEPGELADVIEVTSRETGGAFQLSVTVRSPDTGCDQYADWWEVLSADGSLLYRRILLHSHVSEQPFTRSGGPVPATSGDLVVVRAHMNPAGYGGRAFRGPIEGPFESAPLPGDFASEVESASPQPDGCDF